MIIFQPNKNWKILTILRENIFQNSEKIFLDFLIFEFYEKFEDLK